MKERGRVPYCEYQLLAFMQNINMILYLITNTILFFKIVYYKLISYNCFNINILKILFSYSNHNILTIRIHVGISVGFVVGGM